MLDTIFSFDTLWWILMILYVPACIGLIVIVLLQKGKGSGFAGAFGAGAGPGSDTVFGPSAAKSLPVRMTYGMATMFMLIAVVMSIIGGRVGKGDAPELIQDAVLGEHVVTTELDGLGVGTGIVGGAGRNATVDEGAASLEEATSATEESTEATDAHDHSAEADAGH